MAQEVPTLFRDDDATSVPSSVQAAAAQSADYDASDATKETLLLSQLLVYFSVKRTHPALQPPRPQPLPPLSSDSAAVLELLGHNLSHVPTDASIHPATDVALASSLLRSPPSERELIQQFLLLPPASRNKVAQSLFVIPPSLIDEFASVMQFFLRALLEAHSDSRHHQYTEGMGDEVDAAVPANDKLCSWANNSDVACVSYEQEEASVGSPVPRKLAVFTLPPGFQACLSEIYGSVQRSKCEEVWHGDHMAYRCRTCGLSDSSCMCLGCFDPSDHEGHDYRVYRCSSGGCCDCGDPLAWKPEGVCKKHRERVEERADAATMGTLERSVVRGLVSRVIAFCIHVLREVYTFCLRPSSTSSMFDGFFSSSATRLLPKTGRRRSSFPSVLQVHLDRMQQCFAWLQALATSCVPYREIVTKLLLETLPADFRLDLTTPGAEQEPSSSITLRPRVVLDVFLKCGVLLPVDMCDTLGVLYLKLLFDQTFKQRYTCHFVDWYPYFIELYLTSSEENNEDGMRNLSRFIDRLFCQLFHSTAQLQELERAFQDRSADGDSSSMSVVERLLSLLLEKLIALFKSTLRVEMVPSRSSQDPIDTDTATPSQYSVQVVDCGRNVFKKRVYARLCSDIRTLLVHPSVAGQVLRASLVRSEDESGRLHLRGGKNVYGLLIQAFDTLQQMDLQERRVQHHIEFESQNWTFAFVVDYEMNLLLSAFLAGLPYCLEQEALNSFASDKWEIACALIAPVRVALQQWTGHYSCRAGDVDTLEGLLSEYQTQVASTETRALKRSFHLPLHHVFAAVIQGVSAIVRPQSLDDLKRLVCASSSADIDAGKEELQFLFAVVDHPLRVALLAREIKSGLWVRNGNVMWQQLIHYYAKHWRFFGLYSDLFVCQLGVLLLPEGAVSHMLMRPQLAVAHRLASNESPTRQDVELLEEMLRFTAQLVLSPVECYPSQTPELAEARATWRLEREMIHWLALGPFSRSEVVAHLDMKLVEQVRLMPGHEWYLLEEEEIVSHVLERVGEYEDPNGASAASAADAGTGAMAVAFGMKMTGTWRLQNELWQRVTPLFECFSPAEAQQCEQNVKKHHLRNRSKLEDTLVPVPQQSDGDFNVESARALSERVLQSSDLLSVVTTVLQRWCKRDSEQDQAGEERVVGESLVVAALQVLYIAASLFDSTDEEQGHVADKDELGSSVRGTFFSTLCWEKSSSEDPQASGSLLSLLSSLSSPRSSLSPDSKALARAIIQEAVCKSALCRRYVEKQDHSRAATPSPTDVEEKQCIAKEMMRRRQQEVMERMRKQQLQFLSSQSITSSKVSGGDDGDAMVSSANAHVRVEVDEDEDALRDHEAADSDDDGFVSTDCEDDDEDDEDDEWGFPTGLINLELYLSHVSSAVSLIHERERRAYQRQHRRLRRRTRSSVNTNPEGGQIDRSLVSRRSSSLEFSDEDFPATEEECALCRLPCDPHNLESTFGFVAMIQPTCLPQKLGLSSQSSQLPPFPRSSRYSPTIRESERNCDTVVWTCGHAIHHSCIKGYIDSLWKNQRNQFEGLHNRGDDRLLSERDLEFQCPVCRRLSNCLLPDVQSVLQPSQSEAQLSYRTSSGTDDESNATSSSKRSFTHWLQAQMTEASVPTSPDAVAPLPDAVQSRLHKFCLQLKHRSVRAVLQLPLLLAGGLDDELVIDAELRYISETWSTQFTTWHLVQRCLEVALDLTIHEKQLLGSGMDNAYIDRQRMQSLRLLSELSIVSAFAQDANIDDGGLPRLQEVAASDDEILFGRKVFFADDDDDDLDTEDSETRNKSAWTTMSRSPLLAHPHLFSVFSLRMNQLLGGAVVSSNADAATSHCYSEELLADVLYTARLVVSAQILQALCSVAVAPPSSGPSNLSSPPRSPVKTGRSTRLITDFNAVETLGDAMQWAHHLIMRCRLISASQPLRLGARNLVAVEAFVLDRVLPLVQRIVLLIQVALPRLLHEEGEAACGLCDELASAFLQPGRPASPARDRLNALMQRLHLPPLRLFFSRFVFSPQERDLCQVWAAQMETKAAVLRRQARENDAVAPVPSLVPSVTESRQPRRLIIDLPKVYMDFFIKYNDKPQGLCQRCQQLPQHPAICLFCGDVLCCFSSCCESPHGRRIGECTQHAQQCGLGTGAFLLLRACTVILFLGNERRCVWGSLYVDKNGEEDPYLRRGRTLFLAPNRLLALETLLLSHSFTQNTSILTNTSRRDGRRY